MTPRTPIPPAPCRVCGNPYTLEHVRQTTCRLCVAVRCMVCRAPVEGLRSSCRQRARSGARNTVLMRDDFRCRVCGKRVDERDPKQLKTLRVASWTDKPTPATTVTLCAACELPDVPPAEWASELAMLHSYMGLNPDRPFKALSRGEKRRFRRNHV